jgi:hypothetical protein
VEAKISQWKACTQRFAGEDLVACGRRHFRAYLKFVGDPSVTATTMWVSRQHRNTFNEQLSKSIFNDLGNAERGAHNQYLFDTELAKRVGKVEAGTGAASDASGLAVIDAELLYAEQSWTTQRRNKSQALMAGAVGADADNGSPSGFPSSQQPPDLGSPPATVGGVLPPPSGGDMPPSSYGRGAAGRQRDGRGDGRGKGKGGDKGGRGSYSREQPPQQGMPPHREDRERQYTPDAKRVVAPPAGSTAHPWKEHGCTWANPAGPNDWDHSMMDIREMKMLNGYSGLRAGLAQCWPSDSTCSSVGTFDDIVVSGRPTAGWPSDHCKYCFYRAKAPPNTPADQQWYYGTGDGAHDAAKCCALKRFLAEGGNKQRFPDCAKYFTSALRFGQTYTGQHRPAASA